MTFRAGHLVVVATTIVAAIVASGGAAATTQPAPLPELRQLNAIRRELGLAPLRSDRVAQRVVTRVARSDRYDRPPQVLDSQPDCAVCDVFFESGGSVDPGALYRTLGGDLPIGFGLWRAGWSAAENLSVFFPAAALVLDPRARTFDVARTPRGMLIVAVTADPRARFRRPVRWPSGQVDPRRQLWIEVLLPPGRGYPHLYDTRGGRHVTVAYPLAVAEGLGRSRLVAFGLNATLAYGRGYRVGSARLAVSLRTRPAPAAFVRQSWRFRSLPAADRTEFLAIVRRTPSVLSRMLGELDGAVEIIGGGRGCLVADACEEVTGDRASIGFSRIEAFVVLHELGHIVFDLALDERGRRIFRAAFLSAGWRDSCCVNLSELFADQLAFWALGRVPAGADSYSDRMYLARAELARLLSENAGYRPLPVRGLLKR